MKLIRRNQALAAALAAIIPAVAAAQIRTVRPPSPVIAPPAANDNSAFPVTNSWIQLFGNHLTTNVQGTTGIPGIDGEPFMHWYAPSSTVKPNYNVDTLRLDHHPSYQGGTGIAGAMHAGCSTTSAQQSIEWCEQVTLDNFAIGGPGGENGENVASFLQAVKEDGAGETWAQVIDAHDPTQNSDPTSALLGSEIGVFGHGTDANRQRIGVNLVFGAYSGTDTTPAHIGFGIWITPALSNPSHSVLDTAIGGKGQVGTLIDASKFVLTGPALAMASGQKIALDQDPTGGSYSRFISSRNGFLAYTTPIGNVFQVDDTGDLSTNGAISGTSYRETLKTPASSSAACVAGQFTDDTNYHYVCVATNTWKRAALAAF